MTPEQKLQLQQIIDSVRPEARELIELAKQDKTTKDGYGTVLPFLGRFKEPLKAQLFLIACIKEGYPKDTATQIMQIQGWL